MASMLGNTLNNKSNDILTTPTRPEEFNSERLNQSVNNSPVEPKQSIENVLLESKRLIKSGFYKKAFNLVESLKAEEVYIPPLASIKLSRRMVICLTRICTRYLTKGDLHRVDHFIKLMNKSFDYMQTWHDLLCSYISKTNPKFNHLRKILTEPSELYEEVLQTGEMARIKIKIPASTQNNLSILSTAESREGKQVNLINRFRQNLMTPKDSGSHYLEDASRLDQESQLLGADNLSGREINASFHLDEFIKYYLISLLNWANFYKTAAKKYDLAYRFLMFAHKLTKVLDSCLDPEVLQLISKIRVALGVLYSEFGRQKEALEILESALNLLQIELSRRISKNKEVKNSSVQMERFKETIRQIILVSMNMAIIYEQRENYARTLESLRLGVWFAGKFLISGDDLYNLINMQYNVASQRYDKYLKELGELERVVPEKKDLNEVEDVQETKTSNHVAKMNYYLYNKFNYERLNANQYIVLTSPSGIDKDMHVKNNKSEFLTEDRTEFGESKNWSRLRDLKTEGSFARTATMEDLDMQYTSNSVTWKRQSTMTKPNTNIRDKKKFRLDTSEDTHTLTSRKYQTEGAFEHDKEEFQLDSEDEREHIEKLNRNIKSKRKLVPGKNGGKLDYLDVDNFFNKVVDKKIQEKEEELKIGQPKQFKKIVKDYGYFLKSEKFDEIEFGFAARTLTARGRENLGEYEISTKYKPPTFKVAQRNEVKIEAQHIEARFSTENKITSRNQSIKSSQVKSPQAKMVKFATSTSGRETKTGTLLAIDEQPSTTRSNHLQGLGGKHTFTGILMRHHEDLGLNTVHDVVSEKEKKALKLAARMKEKSEMKTLGLLSPSALNRFETPKSSMSARSRSNIRRFNTQDISKFAETTKNTIQLMMETIEKNIEEGEDIKHRIEYNKPLIEVQKPTDKFLKVPDELAKSTVNLSFKAQGSKKIWNFSQLVKNSHLANKKTVTIKAP